VIKPFDFSWLPQLPAQARQWFQELFDQFRTVQAVVTASRAVGTVYRNTSARPMFVTSSFYYTGAIADVLHVYSDASNPPTTEVAKMNMAGADNVPIPISFVVLPGNYYEVDSAAAATVYCWTEWY
jgi:hypothetical protein